jgi:hypothetical protein
LTKSIHCDRWRSLTDEEFNDDRHHAGPLYVERVSSARREIEDAVASVRATIVDFDND